MVDEKMAVPDKEKNSENDHIQGTDYGAIKMDDEVIASIAALTVLSLDGVAGMVGGVTAGITEMLGKKPAAKGVKVERAEDKVSLSVSISVCYGAPIPELAHRIQRAVVDEVRAMTGIVLNRVDVYVQGLQFPDQDAPPEGA